MKQKRRISKMIGMILSGSIIITSIPIAGVAAQNTDSKPTADELLPAGYMKPEDFDRDAVNAYADSIVAGTSSISDIGRLPQYSEFVAQTGYSHSVLSLTVFRETYGTGTDFQAPVNAVICIKNESELDLLSSLVNHNEANETAEEQAYYANASYTLQGDILYTSRRFLPIGTVTTPFNGSFDGDGFEITGLQINGDSQSTYTGVEYFGLFGYIGAEGQVSNLGLTNTTINLPYTLGADVGVLAGRNYGTISDCYVNGTENWYDDDYNEYDMNTTRVTVSNGTVGGIAAENYGTIERVYADFVPNVSITSGTYSEPQPIASINRGTITDSYYFGEEINGYFGTAITADEMVETSGIPGTKFKGADFVDLGPTQYPVMYSIEEAQELFGTGSTFDADAAQAFLDDDDTVLAITYNADGNNYYDGCLQAWNQFAELVNNEAPNETTAEQYFYSHATVYLGGFCYANYDEHHYSYMLLTIGRNKEVKAVGTSEYPFYGTLDGGGINLNINWDYDWQSDTSTVPPFTLFGVIGEGGTVKNTNVSINWYEASINDSEVSPSGVFFLTNNGTVENCNVHFEVSTDNYDVIKDMLFSIGVNNNGIVKNCIADTWNSNFSEDIGAANAIRVNNGTVENLDIYYYYGDETTEYNGIGTLTTGEYYDLEYRDDDKPVGVPKRIYNDYRLTKYPAISDLVPDADGRYHISKPSQLMYFVQNGKGETCILDNTIDMQDTLISSKYTGSFTLDGTLTNEDDICSYIDLGTGTRCYGILNLSFVNSVLSEGEVNISNVYFIGGSYTTDPNNNYCKAKNCYGKNISNVHSSMDIDWGDTDDGDTVLMSLSENAALSSYSGTITVTRPTLDFWGIAENADNCTSYARINNNISDYGTSSSETEICIIGYNVTNCIDHYDYAHSSANGNNYNYKLSRISMGEYVENCISSAEYVVDKKIAEEMILFGHSKTKNCVFSGHIVNTEDFASSFNIACRADGFVFDGVADGYYTGCDLGENVIFRGTVNTSPAFTVKAVGESVENSYNIGTINITQVQQADGYVYGVGTDVTNCVMSGTINYLKSEDDWNIENDYGFRNISYFGSGNGMNLTDIIIDDIPVETVSVFVDTTENCYNYGSLNINTSYGEPVIYIGDQVTHCYNLGDVYIEGSDIVYLGLCCYLSQPTSSQRGYVANSNNVNFGKTTITEHGTMSDINPVVVSQEYSNKVNYYETAYNNYNVGDIAVVSVAEESGVYINGCYGGKNYGTISCRDYNGDTDIAGATIENYGDINVSNIGNSSLSVTGVYYAPSYNQRTNSSESYNAVIKSYGDITVSNCDCDSVSIAATFCSLNSTNHNLTIDSRANITVENTDCGSIEIVGGMKGSDLGHSGSPTINVSDNSISLSDILAVDIDIYGASVGYGCINPYYNMYYKPYVNVNSTMRSISIDGFTAWSVNIYGTADSVNNGSNNADITVTNGNISGGITIYGVAPRISGKAVNKGDIVLDSITPEGEDRRYLNISGVGSTENSTLNTGNITVSGINDTNSELTVDGIGTTVKAPDNGLVMNSGNIDISGSFNAVCASGVAHSTETVTNNGVLLNSGSITIASGDINSIICGGVLRTGDSSKFVNGMNLGDITVNKPVEAALTIYGVGAAYDMQSLVNWGDITVTGMNDSDDNCICAVGVGSYGLCAWLNYGNVTTDLNEPTEALIGAVDLDGSVQKVVASTGINYGIFSSAHLSGNGGSSEWFVDLSGNKNVIPAATYNYSTDPDANNVKPWCDDEKYFNRLNSLKNGTYGRGIGDYEFTYETMMQPRFGFLYCNPLALRYKSSTATEAAKKEEYNGENILDYADKDELRGQTFAYLSEKYTDMDSGYCLNGSTLSSGEIAGHLDTDIEDCVNLNSLNFVNDTVSSRWGRKTVRELFENDLNQRDIGTAAKLNHYIYINSIEKLPTNTGAYETLSNKTSLVPFQAPLDEYAYKGQKMRTLVTIADLYMQTNEFTGITGQDVQFRVDIHGSKNITFRYFDEPVIFESEEEMKNGIKERFKGPGQPSELTRYTGLDIPYHDDEDAYTTISIPEENQTAYVLAGLAVSENGRRTNALVIRLHSVGTMPSAWVTEFSYPTAINDVKTAFVSEEILKEGEDHYTESNIYEDTADYTVTSAVANTDSFGDIVYPVYTMTKNMVYSSDGIFSNDNTNSLTETGNLSLKFALKNVSDYIIYVNSDDSEDTWFATGTMSDDNTQISDNGVETVKLFDDQNSKYTIRTSSGYRFKILKSGTVDTDNTDNSRKCWIDNNYKWESSDYLNPFLSGGTKTITVGTKSISGEFIPLCKVIMTKAYSNENYIKSRLFKRHDLLTENEDTVYTRTRENIVPSYFSIIYFNDNKFNTSTLSKKNVLNSNTFSDYLQIGETFYPTRITNSVNITAENGDTATYTQTTVLPEVENVPIWSIKQSSATIATGDEPLIMLTGGNVDYDVVYSNSIVKFRYNRSNMSYYDGTTSYRYSSGYDGVTLKKIEIYVNGELSETLSGGKWGADFLTWQRKKISFQLDNPNHAISIYNQSGYNKGLLPEGIITVKPVIVLNTNNSSIEGSEVYTMELQPFSMTKTLSKEHRVIKASLSNAIVTAAISTKESELSENVDIYGDGTIDYTLTPDETNHFYICNTVDPSSTSSELSIKVPAFARIQTFNGSTWDTVFTAGSNTVYTKTLNYTASQIGAGYHYDFRVIAQAYNPSDDTAKNYVSYYNTVITATTRNKDITIDFDTGTETMGIYQEIIAEKGSTAIQIKNMNGTNAVLQQTKLYKSTSVADLESTYYKLAQGDYAIDVQLPDGYKARVKIVGGSSEGYLHDSNVVKGKRIRLPYANAQSIRLVVYLQRDDNADSWGVEYSKTLHNSVRQNKI